MLTLFSEFMNQNYCETAKLKHCSLLLLQKTKLACHKQQKEKELE